MDISLKSITLLGAVILTGLSAGFFYAWSVSVIPGNKQVVDLTYLETMQSINRAILNPAFFLIFFGSMLFLGLASFYQFHNSKLAFLLILSSTIIYLFGTIGVTGLGNVPLNNQLDVLNLSELSSEKITEFREYYETRWNQLHLIRTIFTVLSFITAVLTLFTQIKNN